MKMTVKVEGLEASRRAFQEIMDRASADVDAAVQTTGQNIAREIVQGIQTGAGGAPNSDTGALAASITYRKVGQAAASISSDLDYAAFLEFGTRKMRPRRVWLPTMERNRTAFREAVAEAIRKATK